MAYVNPYEREQRRKAEQTELQRLYAQEEQGGTPASAPVEGEEPGIVRRAFDTVMDVRNNIGIGAWGSIEGIVDSLVLGPIGAVGGIFSSRFADTMKKAIQYNVTEDFLFKNYQKGSAMLMGGDPSGEHSYLKDDGTVNSIARGVGGMLPAVVVSIATMGAGTPAAMAGSAASAGGSAASAASAAATAAKAAKLAQTLSTVTMAAGAAGQAEQEAYQDGADFYGGQAYGVLRGATEAATEYALGGTTKLITGGGKAVLPGVRRSAANVGLKRVAKAALEEGLEEGISESLDPLTRTTYKGKEALAEYADPAFYGQVLKAVKDGSLTGLVFQGTVGHAMGNTGKAADMREIRDELDTLEKKRRNLHKNNTLTDDAEAAIGADVRENYRVMESVLKKATPEKRATLMEEHGLSDKFDGNGTMKADFAALLDRRATVGQRTPDGENGAPAGSAGLSGGFDRRTASVDAEAEKVAKVLAKEGREQFTDVDSLSREGQKNLRDVKRVMEVFRDISDGAVGEFVIAKESVSDNAYFDPETGYTVIGADALENGINVARKGVQSWFQTAIHEATHGTEKTVAWFALSNQLRGLEGGKVYNEMLKQLGNRGYFNGKAADIRAEVEKIARKLERGEALTDKQTAFAEDFMSESVAIMAEQALGNAHFARELLDADASVVEKLLHKIEDVKEALARRKDAATKEAFEEVRKAEQMFLDALAEKGLRLKKGKIIGAGDEKDDPKHSEVKFSIGHDKNGNKYWHIETGKDIFRGIREKEKMREAAFDYIIDNRDHQVIVEDLDGRKIEFIRLSAEEFTRSEESQDLYEKDPEIFKKKMRMIPSLEDLVKYSSVSWTSPDHKNHKSYHKKGFINYRGKVRIDNVIFDYIIRVGQAQKFNGFHDINLEVAQYLPHATKSDTSDIKGATPNNKIPHSNKNVKPSDEISSEKSSKPVQKARKAISKPKDKLPTEAELPEDPRTLELRGDQRKALANWSRNKVYTLKDATEIVDGVIKVIGEIAAENSVDGKEFHAAKVLKKVREKSIDQLFADLNTASTATEREAAARKVAESMISEARVEVLLDDEEVARALDLRMALQQYRFAMDLSAIEEEAKKLYGKGKNPLTYWRAKEAGRGMTPEEVKAELEEKAGLVMLPENPLDIVLWLEEQFNDANDKILGTGRYLLKDSLEGEDYERAVNALTQEILDGFAEKGHKSAKAAMQEEHERQLAAVRKDRDKRLEGMKAYHREQEQKQRKKHAEYLAKFRSLFQEKQKVLREETRVATRYANELAKMRKLAQGIKGWKTGQYRNGTQPFDGEGLKKELGILAELTRSNVIHPKRTRAVMAQVFEWYESNKAEYRDYIGGDRKLLGAISVDRHTVSINYDAEIAGKLYGIAKGSGKLTVDEIHDINDILSHFKHTVETYNKIWINGKLVDAIPEAEKYVSIEQENQELRQGKMNFIMSSWYMRCYADPHTLVRYMDCYREGFYSTMFERLRAGTIQSQVILKKMNDKINEALEDPEQKKKREERNSKKKHGLEPAARNTEYFKSLSKRKIHLHGADMPVGEAISLYMTCNREQAKAGLLENGYSFAGEGDGNDAYIRRVFGFTGNEKVRDDQGRIKPEYAKYIQGMQDEIYGQLSELDRKFIAVATELLNNDCKKYKRVTDLALNGWSNVAEEYYFPIRRYETFKSIDKEGFFGEVDHVTNASFNKNTKPGARNQLLIESIDVVLARHMRGVAKYAALGQVIRDYDTLRTLDVSGNPNAAVSIAAIEGQKGGWIDGTDYFAQLLKDVQGIREEKQDEVTKIVGKLRGNYAKFQLAANPKVIATQLSSLFAGMNIIDPDVMIYAFNPKVNGRDVYDYSELAEIRASENTAAMAQGLLDEAGDKLMAPIGWMDSWVVRRLWVASQHQIAKSGPKLGTEENKKAAAKLLDKVILETQQNALATEKSQAARSHSEIQKMLTMFTSDAVKGVGQLLDAVGEITVIRNEAKVRKTPVDTKRLAAAKRRAGRAAGSLAAVAVYGAILAAIIKKLLDRDDEWTWVDFLSEVGGGLLGGLPIIKEAYEMFWGSGYGMEDMSVAAVNDLMSSTKDTFEGLGALASGDLTGREALRGGRNLLYSLGQVTGMPIRNAYTWSRRLVGIVVPDAAYKMENAFTKQPYASDIAKAIEREDEGRLETVIGVMLDENVGEVTSSAVRKEMKRLVVSGMDVLPRGVGDTVTVDGEAVKLTARQKTAFKEVYSEANKSVERMVGLAYYSNASDEAKTKAIKRVYGIYYNRAIEDLLGVELENKNTLLSRAINPEVLAVVLAVCGEITADVGKDGKVVAGSKRKKVEAFVESLKLKAAQKYMIMGALGYKNKKGREKVLAYVNGLGLSKSEREAIMGYSGY